MLNRCPQEAYYRFEIAGIDGLLGNREEQLNAYIKIFEQYDKLYGGVYNKRIKKKMYKIKNSLGMTIETFPTRKSAEYWLNNWRYKHPSGKIVRSN